MVSLEEKVEKLASRVEELEEENRKLKQHIKDKSTEDNSNEDKEQEISRRSFLRKLGAGAVGLGALSLAPAASKLTITDSGIEGSSGLNFLDSGSQYFKVNSGGPVEVQNTDLRIPTGNSIEDGSGTRRVTLNSASTFMSDENGDPVFIANHGNSTQVRAWADTPFQISDREGTYTAVQYDTDASAGVLRTPSAGVAIQGSGTPSTGSGLQATYTDSGPWGRVFAYDWGTDSYQRTRFEGNPLELVGRGGLIDATRVNADLRLAADQVIESSDGTRAYRVTDSTNSGAPNTMFTTDGSAAFNAYATDDANGVEIRAYSGDFFLMDEVGSFDAVSYYTSSSAPGTLEMTNANLNLQNNAINSARYVRGNAIYDGSEANTGEWLIIQQDGQLSGSNDGDVYMHAQDEAGSGSKMATLFDYSAGSVSSERYKKNIRSLDRDPHSLLNVKAKSWTSDDANSIDVHGFIAEDLMSVMPEAVITTEAPETEEELEEDEWFTREYLEKNGYSLGDEVPNQIRPIPIIAAHHEIIREQQERIEELEDKVEE